MGNTLPRNRMLLQQPLAAVGNQHRTVMQGVTDHFFWLRADMARLRRFIDSYLNFVDDDLPPPFYFQPAAPFVAFQLLYYPYITDGSRNLASYPYREMSFTVPLECYAIEDGALVFKQFAVCTPFLYVDDQLAIVAGRDLFGLPKVALKFEDPINPGRPDLPTKIGQLTLRAPGPLGDSYIPFIDVYRDAPRYTSASQLRGNLISALPDAIRGYSSVAIDAWQAFARPPIMGYDNSRDLQSSLGMLRSYGDALSACFPIFEFTQQAPGFHASSADEQLGPLYTDLISLKQARDAELPDLVSYQSLVRSTMYFDRINDGGVLFGPVANDPMSDITVKIRHLPGQPVVESLGLITEETYSEGGAGQPVSADLPIVASSGIMVSTLKPVLPYWMNVDLAYGLGTTLYWRGRNTQWSSSDNAGLPNGGNRYLTTDGGALQQDASLFAAPNTVLWVFQLPLDLKNRGWDRLNRLCSEYLKNDRYVFQLAKDEECVWMFAGYGNNTAEGQGPTGEQEVEFAALVQWSDNRNGRAWGPPRGTALMPILVLSDNQKRVFTESEVFGRPAMLAELNFLPNKWDPSQIAYTLGIKTLLLPELYTGATPVSREIVRLRVRLPTTAPSGPPAQTLSSLIFPSAGLKQIVDCRIPDRVDFQAIVFRVLSISSQTLPEASAASFLRLLDEKVWTVWFSRYGSLPLVAEMGLQVDSKLAGPKTTIDQIRPKKVWAIPACIEDRGAVNFAWRLGDSPWMSHDDPVRELEQLAPGISQSIQNPADFANTLAAMSIK